MLPACSPEFVLCKLILLQAATLSMSIIIRELDQLGAPHAHHDALHATNTLSQDRYVCVGDEIPVDDEDMLLRGHGTHLVDEKLIATLCGVVERVNKLVLVRPLKTRYDAAQGDVVVGRVTEVAGKRWKVDLASRQEAHLLLSAVNLPGGIQRRRNAEDELKMREVLREGDLLSAEVQSVHMDGSVALHTRSSKYGKLIGGQLIQVPAALVKRQKQHFHSLEPTGTHIILGVNGVVWVAPHPSKGYGDQEEGDDASTQEPGKAMDTEDVTKEQLQAVVVVGNAVRALARCYLPIYPATITATIELAHQNSIGPFAMLEPSFLEMVVTAEAGRRATMQQ